MVDAITVTYGVTGDTATDGQDFVGGQGTVTIPAGVSRVTVPIPIINDNLPEPTETFVFSLITAANAAQNAAIGVPRTSRVSILDDETPAPPPNPEPPLTSNYNVTPVSLVNGLNQPVRFVFSPVNPSQVYVAEKPGIIALSDLTTGTTRTVIDLSNQVNDFGDRGLLDIALDPNFAQNGFIYAFEVIDPPDTAGKTGNAGPDGIGNRYAQVIRYTADPATNFSTILPNSAKILLGNAGQSLADISGGGAQDFTDPAFADAISSDQFINPERDHATHGHQRLQAGLPQGRFQLACRWPPELRAGRQAVRFRGGRLLVQLRRSAFPQRAVAGQPVGQDPAYRSGHRAGPAGQSVRHRRCRVG